MTGLLAALWQPFLTVGRYLRRLDLSRGTVDVTDARTLWEQQTQLRHEAMTRIAALEARVAELLHEIAILHEERTGLLVRIAQLEGSAQ